MGHLEGQEYRFCRMCDIIASIPGDIGAYADRLYGLLKEDERAGEDLIKERMQVCEGCAKNSNGTCLACGCYCLIRSIKRDSICPYKKW